MVKQRIFVVVDDIIGDKFTAIGVVAVVDILDVAKEQEGVVVFVVLVEVLGFGV